MLEGPERLVLQACRDLPKDRYGNVDDAQISQETGLSLLDVKTVLECLEEKGFVTKSRLESGQYVACVTHKGNLELSQRSPHLDESRISREAPSTIKVVPKGLRSYDEHDADFFLDLLPGPRRSNGLPESVHFWKVRTEQTETEKSFRVGVIYGPSGCGKSSLVKAGLLPKIRDDVCHVYVEATANRTESDLLTGIRSRYPDLSPGLGLVESLAALRNRTEGLSGEKILLVLDQFEQWLLEHRGEEDAELVRALRHCDEEYNQAILMVRDDFLAATIRFMKEIGVEFRPDHNACEVELFSPRHAEKVLTAFGRAEGILRDDLTTEQQRFITQSIEVLAHKGGLVIPVRLAIFFQTVKNQSWNSKTLRKFGDAEKVGAAFLEKTFHDEYANRRHRDHQEAAQLVLGALLPESGHEIRRLSRARQELLEASGYLSQPKRFDDLIRILDEELRLITAIDQDKIVVASLPTQTTGERERFYQLTHDFLVPSLREWRSNKDREASQLVEAIWMAETRDVPSLVNRLSPVRFWANPLLRRSTESSGVESKEHLHASLALLPVDQEQVDFLYSRLLVAGPAELQVIRDALLPFRDRLIERLWRDLEQSEGADHTLQAASALALYDSSAHRWDKSVGKVAEAMVTVNAVHLGFWLDALRPVRERLVVPLATLYRDRERSETERNLASDLLEDYATDQPHVLTDLLMDSGEDHFARWFGKLAGHNEVAVPLLKEELGKSLSNSTEAEKDGLAERQARAAIALVRLGHASEVWPRLQHSPDPRLRSFIVNWLAPLGVNPQEVASQLIRIQPVASVTPAEGQQLMDAVLFHLETSMRRALILAMGTYKTDRRYSGERELLIGKLLDLYRDDADSGIHGAVRWTLRQWGEQAKLQAADAELMKLKDRGDRRWYVNSQGQTFAVIEGPVEFSMGSPASEPERFDDELLHRRIIPRRFAIAATEVTVEQYQAFVSENPGVDFAKNDRYSPALDGPMNEVNWYQAAAYCNWLSRKEGLPECYEPNEQGRFEEGMRIKVDALKLTGYRLPTEAEWEYACRAGAETSRYYGASVNLLGRYAWYVTTSQNRAWPCGSLKPNDLGVFDILGNVYEWCQEQADDYFHDMRRIILDNIQTSDYVLDKNPRILRGGTFSGLPADVRSAFRFQYAPAYRLTDDGFRPSRTWQQDVHPVPPESESVFLSRRVQPSPGRRPVPNDHGRSDK